MLISQVVEIINGNQKDAHGNKSIAAVSQQHGNKSTLINCNSKEGYDGGHDRNRKRSWLIRIRSRPATWKQTNSHGNKTQTERDVGLLWKQINSSSKEGYDRNQKQKETLADYGNKSAKN